MQTELKRIYNNTITALTMHKSMQKSVNEHCLLWGSISD